PAGVEHGALDVAGREHGPGLVGEGQHLARGGDALEAGSLAGRAIGGLLLDEHLAGLLVDLDLLARGDREHLRLGLLELHRFQHHLLHRLQHAFTGESERQQHVRLRLHDPASDLH
ncbi:MAG: hypothetical protein ACK55I_51440, partial [bacterium]